MSWPMSQDFNEAIQNPKLVFNDPDLRDGEPVVGAHGMPLPRSGNFADVYQLRGPGGREWAVKCFTRPVTGLGERYAAISEALAEANFPFSVGFEFQAEGIRVGGVGRPIVKMEWVEGLLFNQVVRDNAGKPNVLSALGQLWVKLCKRLREARVAHADLQHGNVLLVPGSRPGAYGLKLIDYDGMYVPALANTPSGESGHPSYQHPARAKTRAYSPDVDRFPHLVVMTALKGLAVCGPDLWEKYDNGDNLLFTEADFRQPETSKVMQELWWTGDPEIQSFVGMLVVACGRPIPQTPWIDDIAPEGDVPPLDANTRMAASAALGIARSVPVHLPPQPAPVDPLPAPVALSQPAPANMTAAFEEVDVERIEESQPPRVRKKKKSPRPKVKKSSSRPLQIVAGVVVLIAAVVAAVLFSGNKHGTDTASQADDQKDKEKKPDSPEGKVPEPILPKPKDKIPEPIPPKPKDKVTDPMPPKPKDGDGGSVVAPKPKDPPPVASALELKAKWTASLSGGQAITRVQILQDSNLVFLIEPKGVFPPLDLKTGQPRKEVAGLTKTGSTSIFSLDGGRIATLAPRSEEIQLWESATGKDAGKVVVPDIPPGSGNAKTARAVPSPDGRYLAVGRTGIPVSSNPDVPFRVFDTTINKAVVTTTWKGGVAFFTADSGRVLAAEWTGRVRWFRLPSGEPDGEFNLGVPTGNRRHMYYGISADGSSIAYNGPAEVKEIGMMPGVLDGKTGKLIRQFQKHFHASEVVISANGRRAALIHEIEDDACTFEVVDVTTGTGLRRVRVPGRSIPSAGLSPDGHSLVIQDPEAEKVYLFDVPEAGTP